PAFERLVSVARQGQLFNCFTEEGLQLAVSSDVPTDLTESRSWTIHGNTSTSLQVDAQEAIFERELRDEHDPLVREVLLRTLLGLERRRSPQQLVGKRAQVRDWLLQVPADSLLWSGFPRAGYAYNESAVLARIAGSYFDDDAIRRYFVEVLKTGRLD